MHQEQAPQRAYFFKPDDANELAKGMIIAAEEFDSVFEEKTTQLHQNNNVNRLREFAKNYERIVLQVYTSFAKKDR